MTEAVLFYGTLIIFGALYIVLALLPQKQIKTKTDYFLAGRNLGVFKATCTLIATQLGAGLLLGTSQDAYSMGLYSLLFTVGISIGLILLGCGIAGRLRALNVVTTTEIFETRYNSPFLRSIASILVTVTLCGILVGNMVASKSLLMSMHVHTEYLYVLFWSFIILYTMIGGLHAVVLTDLLQVTFIAITFVGIALYSLWAFPPTFSIEALRAAQQAFTGHLPRVDVLLPMLLMPALFALFEQDLAQIFFASRTPRVATTTAIVTTIFMLTFGIIPIYLGMQAKLMGIVVTGVHSPLLAIVRSISNTFVLVMVACGVLAAIASTADALLCAIGANITQDFSLSFLGLSPLVESKLTIFMTGVMMLVLSYFMPSDIITILVRSYEIPVSCLCVPLVAAYVFNTVQWAAGMGGFLGGVAGFIVFNILLPIPFQSLWVLASSFVGYVLGALWERAHT